MKTVKQERIRNAFAFVVALAVLASGALGLWLRVQGSRARAEEEQRIQELAEDIRELFKDKLPTATPAPTRAQAGEAGSGPK